MNAHLFTEAVLALPEGMRCMQTAPGAWKLPLADCFFGTPADKFYGWETLTILPPEVNGFNFYLGSECTDLIEAYINSHYPEITERLMIGNSSFGLGKGRNYADLVEIMAGGNFPNLKHFELGVWTLFHNAHCLYGKLGDVTELLQKMPALTKLELCGAFKLAKSPVFPMLEDFTVTLDDYVTGVSGGDISQSTFHYLINSDLPAVEEIFFDLECADGEVAYQFTDKFLSGEGLPVLKIIEITGRFSAGEKEKLLKSPLGQRPDLIIYTDDMIEA